MGGNTVKKILVIVMLFLIATGCVFAATFEKYQLLDDFGDPVGEKSIKSKVLNGTYKTASVQDGKMTYTILIQKGGVIQIRIVEAGNTGNLVGAAYTSDTFTVTIRPDSGSDVTATASVKQGDDKKYNVLQFSGASALAAFTDNKSVRIVIKNDRATYSLGTVDTSEVEGLYYDKALNDKIDSLLASKNYEEVICLINAEGATETASYYGFSGKLMQSNKALGMPEVGDRGPAGGWIFYDCDADNATGNADGLISTECGWRYLEAAPSDLDERYVWGPDGTLGTATGIGTGKSNTDKIPATRESRKTAAQACKEYSINGYGDWFLPSNDELNLMYLNLKRKGIGDFSSSNYWSSSENSNYSYYAWSQYFGLGDQNNNNRRHDYKVRPVRAF